MHKFNDLEKGFLYQYSTCLGRSSDSHC